MSYADDLKIFYVACFYVLIRLKSFYNSFLGVYNERHRKYMMRSLKDISRHKRFYF